MTNKVIVDAYDVHRLTAYSMPHCRRILRKIKRNHNKGLHQKVTLHELSDYLGITLVEIKAVLNGK